MTQIHPENLVTQKRPTLYFFGVTTGKSSIRKLFPLWSQILGIENAQLVGVDLPINAPAFRYRQAVAQIKLDPLSMGGLVTTHKINTMRAASDLFDNLTEDAALCDEVSCIYKRQGRLIAHAIDPTTCGLAMDLFLEPGYWGKHKADLMCLGAGGASVAIAVHFATRRAQEDQPRRMLFIDCFQPALDNLQKIVHGLSETNISFEFICSVNPAENERLMADLPPGSMVINATGMGKDIPGSPITDEGLFPQYGIAWELNYRGRLDFMRQAQAQASSRGLTIVDGWDYFLIGWAAVMRFVFDLNIPGAKFEQMKQAAESIRE